MQYPSGYSEEALHPLEEKEKSKSKVKYVLLYCVNCDTVVVVVVVASKRMFCLFCCSPASHGSCMAMQG